jgi:hypothetical protein
MEPPTYTPPVDPNLQAQQQTAELEKTDALQKRLKSNTADVMMRYGARSALTGNAAGGAVAGGAVGGGAATSFLAPLSLSSPF